LRLLLEIERTGFPAGGRLEQVEASLSSAEDQRFFHNLISEVLRHRLRLDHLIDSRLAHTRLSDLPPPIRAALRLGAAQLLRLSSVPAHAAVDTSVSLASRHGHKGTAGLVNAVLRRLATEGREAWNAVDALPSPREDPARLAAHLSLKYSHPEWLIRRFLDRWGEERTERVLAFDNSIPDYWVRRNPPEDAALPQGAAPGWIPGTARFPAGSRPAELPSFARGEWTIQDGSAILVGMLPPRVRGLVVDLCAAPGTKTGHLLERAEAGTRVLACDFSRGRLRRLRRGLSRWAGEGDAPCSLVAADGRRPPLREGWDGVLIDAPCSNLGVLRRRLDLRWRAREEEIQRLAAVQAALLDAAASRVAAGGWLVYSVCTLEPEETISQRDRFFGIHADWLEIPLPAVVPETARGRTGEMILLPGEMETDGTYAFVAGRGKAVREAEG